MQAPDNNNNHLLCQGTTSDGLPCKRTPSASAGNGFCYQHQSQDQDQHDHDIDDDQQSMDLEEEEDQIKEEEVPEQEPVEEHAVVLELTTRCAAIASTTKLRCKKLVSFPGEQFCPTHGGRQHKEKVLMALCQAISKTTRQPCKRRVNFAGQQFCSHHGGRKVSDANTLKPTAPPPATNPTMSMMDPITVARFMYQPPQFNNGNSNNNAINNNNASGGFDSLQLANHCVEFLSETHPRMMHACGCDAQKNVQCKSMTIIKWVQLLIKLTQDQQHVHGGDVFSIRDPQAFHSLTQLGVFADLYTAVAIFDSSMDFLPALFRHMRTLGGGNRSNMATTTNKREPSFPPTTPSSPLHLSPSMSSIASWSQIAPHFDDNDHHDDGNDNNVA